MSDDLRGSTPVYSAKDILVRLDDKVDKLDIKMDGLQTAVQILVSQNLNERVLRLESDGSRNAQEALKLARGHEVILSELRGAQTMVKALFGTNAVTALMGGAALLKAMHVI